MTREEAIDVVWGLLMVALPLGSDLPNTPEDHLLAKKMVAGVGKAMEVLGVSVAEMQAAQARWEASVAR